MAAATVLSRQAKRAANGIKKTVLADLAVFLPIVLCGREGETQQIRRSRKHAAAHAQTEHGSFEKAGCCVAGGGEPFFNLAREACGHTI